MPGRPPPVWALEPVRIADPDPAWPERAAEFAAELHSLLGRWLRSDYSTWDQLRSPALRPSRSST